jgi:uncharacterized protein (TIGR02588 family)
MGSSGSDKPAQPQGPGRISPLEWVVAGLSLLLVLSVAGFLLEDVFRSSPSPPRITFQVDSVVRAGKGYLVEFRALNAGRTTAAALVVEGELLGDTGTVETTGVSIGYVPSGGETAAGLFFDSDPRRYRLEIRAKGYDHP